MVVSITESSLNPFETLAATFKVLSGELQSVESSCVDQMLKVDENSEALQIAKDTIFRAIFEEILIQKIRLAYTELSEISCQEIKVEFYLVQ